MQEDSIIKQYIKEEEIKEILKIFQNKTIKKSPHFHIRIIQRDISERLINETFPLFKKIKLIDKRKHKKGDLGYDLYYKLSNSKTLKLCFIVKNKKILLVNAMLRHRKWQGSIRLSSNRR